VETKKSDAVAASSVDFAKDLGLDFPSLKGFGAKIDEARMAADPVALATDAKELAALEKVSGKTAGIKSDDLAKEAVELASRRYQATELRAVALILGDTAGAAKLDDVAAKAETAAASAAKDKAAGVKQMGIGGSLHVDSRVDRWLSIYVNGVYVGQVRPGGDGIMYVGNNPYLTTLLEARDAFGNHWVTYVNDAVNNYTWICQ
jgi:hypothetical protein